MRRELSSRHAYIYRWVIPALLTLGAVAAIWEFAITRPGQSDMLSVATGVLIAAALMILARILDRAKRVWLDGDSLVVSDYRHEARVDLADIERVTQTRFFWPERVRICFSRPTLFGDSIVFFPPLRFTGLLSPHPVVADLSSRAEEACAM